MSGNNGQGPKLFTVKEAALYIGCSPRQIRQEMREGKITYRRTPGGIRFLEEDLLERLRPCGGPAFIRIPRSKKTEETEPIEKRDQLAASWKFSDQDSWPCGQGASFSTSIRVVCSQSDIGVTTLEDLEIERSPQI